MLNRARGIKGLALVPEAKAFVSCICRSMKQIINSADPPIKAGTSGMSALFQLIRLTRCAPAFSFYLRRGEAEEEQKEGYPHQ